MIFGRRQKERADSFTLKTYRLNEAEIKERLKDLEKTCKEVRMLSHPKGVDVRIILEEENEKVLREALSLIQGKAERLLGDCVYGTGNDKMEEIVGKTLKESRKTIAVAESCTGGLVCHWLTNVPGSSDYLKEGVVTYSNEAKLRLPGLDEEVLKKFGAVSRETAEKMAEGVKNLAKSDMGLSTTGIAGPGGGSSDKPVGLTYIGLSDGEKLVSEEYRFTGWRELIKVQASQAALDLLRRNLR